MSNPKFKERTVRFCDADCEYRCRLPYFCDKYKEMLSFLRFEAVSCKKCIEESKNE